MGLMIGKTKLLLKLTLCSVLVTYGTASTMKTGNVIKIVVGTGHPTAGYVVMRPTEVCIPVFSSTTNKVTEYETITCTDATTVRVDRFSDAGCKTKTSSKVLKVYQVANVDPQLITSTCAMGVKTSGYAYNNFYSNSTAQCGATNLCKSELYAAGICVPFTQKVGVLKAQSNYYSKNGVSLYSDT